MAAAGGTGSTTVTAPTGCAWTGVSNNTSWLTVTSGASGNGTGTVAFSAAANPNGDPAQRLAHDRRADVLGDAGRGAVHLCDQPDEPVGGRRRRHGIDGGDGADRLCVDGRQQQHVVADGDEWGERQRRRARSRSAPRRMRTATQRSGSLDDRRADVLGDPGGGACTYAINPTSQSVAAAGGTGSTAVTAPTGCAWTGVSNNTSWLTVTSGASGNGTGTVAFSAAANPNATQRSGSLTIGGQTFSVTQAAAPCTYRDQPGEPVGGSHRRHGVDDGHDIGRLCVDRRQQQHVVADGHEWCQRQRHGHGRVQRRSQSEGDATQRLADNRRPDVLGDAGRGAVHLCDQPGEPVRGSRRRHGIDGGDGADRLCVDGRQ